MELALESTVPALKTLGKLLIGKDALDGTLASSKLPRMPQTATLSPSCVDICRFCTRLTLPSG